jgi:FAD/FMN-containing dehydrogenase
VRPMRYHEIYAGEAESDYHPVAAARTLFIDTLDRGVAETIVDRLQASQAQMAVTQVRVLGGAMARVPADATAFAHRARRIMVNVAALYARPEEEAQHTAWVKEYAGRLHQGDAAGYVNFLGDEGAERIRAAYPGETWGRLRAIKAHYDPTNLFRLNQNIPPAVEEPRA